MAPFVGPCTVTVRTKLAGRGIGYFGVGTLALPSCLGQLQKTAFLRMMCHDALNTLARAKGEIFPVAGLTGLVGIHDASHVVACWRNQANPCYSCSMSLPDCADHRLGHLLRVRVDCSRAKRR